MPFWYFPHLVILELIKKENEFLSDFSTNESVDDSISILNIIRNLLRIDCNDLNYEFGQCVQLNVTENKTNTEKSRTLGAIVIRPYNRIGQNSFMFLEKGRIMDGRVISILTIASEVFKREESFSH